MQGGKHSAAAYSELEKWAYGSCVASATSFVVSAGTGMNLNISTGAGIISDTIARRIGTDAVETATVPTASATYNRIDAVVAYIDTAVAPTTSVTDNTNDILKFVVVAGTAAASPVAPNDSAIQSAIGAGKPFMRLYNVTVPQNATNTSGMTLTDLRVVIPAPNIADGVVTTAKIVDSAITTAKLNNSSVTTPKVADGAITYAKTDGSMWYEELARVTLGSAANNLTLSSIPAKKYLKILITAIGNGADITVTAELNGDTGNNYATRVSSNGATDATGASSSALALMSTASRYIFTEIECANDAAREKVMLVHSMNIGGGGAANVPDRQERAVKWANTSNQISSITIRTTSNNYAAGTQIIVLGHD